jgi:hypothetical protein
LQADCTGTVIEVMNPSCMALGNAMQEDIGSGTTTNNQQPRGMKNVYDQDACFQGESRAFADRAGLAGLGKHTGSHAGFHAGSNYNTQVRHSAGDTAGDEQ